MRSNRKIYFCLSGVQLEERLLWLRRTFLSSSISFDQITLIFDQDASKSDRGTVFLLQVSLSTALNFYLITEHSRYLHECGNECILVGKRKQSVLDFPFKCAKTNVFTNGCKNNLLQQFLSK